jgi:DNA-binding HxlR family transcriptional regulator
VASKASIRRLGAVSGARSASSERHLKSVRGDRAATSNEEAANLDALLHHRIRLGIVSALAGTTSLSFNEIKALLKTTDGNLSVHARKLEDAHYVVCRKSFAERRPRTDYQLAAAGRRALQRYLDHMEALIRTTRTTLEG